MKTYFDSFIMLNEGENILILTAIDNLPIESSDSTVNG
jgi:hypothetical protein